jgi:hypothetical protein
LVLKENVCVYSSPIESDKFNGVFVVIWKIEKCRSACGRGYKIKFDSSRQLINAQHTLHH